MFRERRFQTLCLVPDTGGQSKPVPLRHGKNPRLGFDQELKQGIELAVEAFATGRRRGQGSRSRSGERVEHPRRGRRERTEDILDEIRRIAFQVGVPAMQGFRDASTIRRLNRVEGQIFRTFPGKQVQLCGIRSRRGPAETFQAVGIQARPFSLRAGLEMAEGVASQKASDILARKGADRPEQIGIAGTERQFQVAPFGVPPGMIGEVDGFEILHRLGTDYHRMVVNTMFASRMQHAPASPGLCLCSGLPSSQSNS